mgnify:FL=1
MEKGWSSSIRLRILAPGYESRRYLDRVHSLTSLMGLPMRYPRLLMVCFVAFGLALASTADARAEHAGAGSVERAYAGSVFDIVDQAVFGGDPVRRSTAVESVADALHLDRNRAGRLLDGFAELVLAVADAGQRSGVLAIPEVNQLFAEILEPASTDGFPAVAADVSERWSEVGGVRSTPDAATTDEMGEPIGGGSVDPVERWRPLVERYFPRGRVGEALSIIACESNGDPSVTNPRSSAAGLFQFVSGTWEHASTQAGYDGSSPFDPEANVASAAWLVDNSLKTGRSPWSHWTCRP